MKKMKLNQALCILALGAAVSTTMSCRRIISAFDDYDCTSTGPEITRVTKINNITGLHSASGLNVTYEQSDSLIVRVSAPDDVMPFVETAIEGNTLSCRTTKSLRGCASLVKINVKAPGVTAFESSSGSSLTIASPYIVKDGDISAEASSGSAINADNLQAASLSARSSSGAAVRINGITVDTASAGASSGASMELSGKTVGVNLSASSGGAVYEDSFFATTGSAKASSGGAVSCNIENPTDIISSSGGSVNNKD